MCSISLTLVAVSVLVSNGVGWDWGLRRAACTVADVPQVLSLNRGKNQMLTFFPKSNTYLGARFLCPKDPCKRNARVTELTFEVSCRLPLESGTTLVPESNLPQC